MCAVCRGKVQQERNQSEVARLLEIIDLEYRSAQQGLSGLAEGCSQHAFITSRMENMERMRQRVIGLVGNEDKANGLVMEQLDKSGQEPKKE